MRIQEGGREEERPRGRECNEKGGGSARRKGKEEGARQKEEEEEEEEEEDEEHQNPKPFHNSATWRHACHVHICLSEGASRRTPFLPPFLPPFPLHAFFFLLPSFFLPPSSFLLTSFLFPPSSFFLHHSCFFFSLFPSLFPFPPPPSFLPAPFLFLLPTSGLPGEAAEQVVP